MGIYKTFYSIEGEGKKGLKSLSILFYIVFESMVMIVF
jgi:hypothetical protein